MRAISLASRALSASISICTSSASRAAPCTATGVLRVAASKSLSASGRTSDSRPSAFSTGAAEAMNSASPATSNGMRSAGDKFISERSWRQAPASALSLAIQASDSASTRDSSAFG